jgi:ABC-type lipoprotein release transport system permease subunit
MLLSIAWRNLARNPRRTVLTAAAVSTAVILLGWLVGFTYGAYEQMIDQAVRTRIGHVQVLAEGYLEQPAPEKVVPGAGRLAHRLAAIDGVEAVSARVLAEGLLARDSEVAPVDLLGVDPEAERAASVVPGRVVRGPRAVRWCREEMSGALTELGGDERLFGRWCEALGQGEFLPPGEPRAVVIGRGVAKRLLVSVGDEITVQVVRAVDGADGAGAKARSLSQRRFVISGVVAAGSPEIDERAAYLHADALGDMLGTEGANEVVVLVRSIHDLDRVRREASAIARETPGLAVSSWAERSPELSNLIGMAKGSRIILFIALGFLVLLSVANATLTSILERRREFGVMLSLGLRRSALVRMIMTEVALLGLLAVAAGAAVAAAIEAFGRLHGWPIEWVGLDPDTLEAVNQMSASGVGFETTFHAAMPAAGAVLIVAGVYSAFLLMGLWSALHVRRLDAVDAVRRG